MAETAAVRRGQFTAHRAGEPTATRALEAEVNGVPTLQGSFTEANDCLEVLIHNGTPRAIVLEAAQLVDDFS